MNAEFIRALDALQQEKNIDKDELIEAIEASIVSAYKKNNGDIEDVEVRINRESGEIMVHAALEIVEEPEDDRLQISLEKAREFDPNYEIGDVYRRQLAPRDFGRIAAQNAKQLIVQRLKEHERTLVYNDFLEHKDEIMTGIIKRSSKGMVFVDVGNGTAVMLPAEQVPGETYTQGDRIKVYMLSVNRTPKGSQINVSRSHPGLVKRLFETEVPEIYDGVVDIISIAREAGSRTKIAVKANDPTVDPVGACVGQKGVRVQNIINELGDEKIDIIKYSDDVEEYLSNALSPAKVIKIIPSRTESIAMAIVDDMQLSLAIGKEGQNVRLAAKLTNWKIDIKSQSDFNRITTENPDFVEQFRGLEKKVEPIKPMEDVLDIQIEEDHFENVLDELVMTDEFSEESVDDVLV